MFTEEKDLGDELGDLHKILLEEIQERKISLSPRAEKKIMDTQRKYEKLRAERIKNNEYTTMKDFNAGLEDLKKLDKIINLRR